jgi:hypothetical protein
VPLRATSSSEKPYDSKQGVAALAAGQGENMAPESQKMQIVKLASKTS